MARIVVAANQAWSVTTNNGGTSFTMTLSTTGALTVPGTISSLIGGFTGTLSHANMANRAYALPDRSGTIALTDATSLMAMLPSVTGKNGYLFSTDGTNVTLITAPTSGLQTLNGMAAGTYPSQTFAIGTLGNSPAFVSVGGVHTLNIPLASVASVTAGLLSNADYANIPFKNVSNTFGGTQTFTNAPLITTPSTNANAAATYGQLQASQAGLSVRPPVAAIDSSDLTLPTANPVIDGYAVALGDRILFTTLSASNNQVYVAGGTLAAMTWTLATDGQAGTGAPSKGDILFVKNGAVHANQQFTYEGASWVLYNVAAAWTFSTGLTVAGNAVSVSYGTTAGTAAQGNDARLSDSRNPLAHQLDGALHTISGKTAGQALIATSATTFAFVSYTGDVSLSGTGATLVNNIQGSTVLSLGLQLLVSALADNTAAATLVPSCAFPVASARNIKIDFSLSRGAGNYACGYLNILYDGTNAWIQEVFDSEIGTTGIVFTAVVTGGNIQLMFTSTSTGTAGTLKFFTTIFPQ